MNYVHVYILQVPLPKFPLVIITLIPNNGRDSANTITNLYKKLLLVITSQLNISIILIGSDGAAAEFKAQSIIINIQTTNKIEIIDLTKNINFNCSILSNIGSVL
ncbi:8745_t:CDS:2 [Diversispora eburnea]|uniref:8745_t:CDS:1 n=1 Tax=Diversispora eburnea TaxID=1213867 RepID=A0A9N9GC83_9GLOM|nr:8745_t:CDS:2 [Diversispora eburnea]